MWFIMLQYIGNIMYNIATYHEIIYHEITDLLELAYTTLVRVLCIIVSLNIFFVCIKCRWFFNPKSLN